MTLTLDNLPGSLRKAAEMIDVNKDFTEFDEAQLNELATLCREVAAEYGECSEDLTQTRTAVDRTAAGEFHKGLSDGCDNLASIANSKKEALSVRAANFERTSELIHDIKARFFEIVTIYWQQAQYYGCKDPSNPDALLRSNTTWVLENARQSWKGLVERHDG